MASGHVTRQAVKTKQTRIGDPAKETTLTEDDVQSPQLTLADIRKCMSEFSDKICMKIDNLTEEVSQLSKKVNEVEKSVQFNSDKITEIEKKELPEIRSNIQSSLSKLEEKLIMMEIYNRKSNLLFYGIPESRGENVFTLLRSTFVSLGVSEEDAAVISFANAHRLPQRNATSSSAASPPAPPPIIAKFATMMDRDRILSAFDQQQRDRGKRDAPPADQPIQHRRISVRVDLPPALKVRRGILAGVAFKLRKERNLSTKITVDRATVILQWKEKGSQRWTIYKD